MSETSSILLTTALSAVAVAVVFWLLKKSHLLGSSSFGKHGYVWNSYVTSERKYNPTY